MISKAITAQANHSSTQKAFNNYNFFSYFQTFKYSAQTLTKSVNLQVQQVIIIHRSTPYYVAILSDIPLSDISTCSPDMK